MSTFETTQPETEQKLQSAIRDLSKYFRKNSDQAKASFTAESKLEKGFLSEVNVRNFKFVSDEPESLGGEDTGPNPVEYVLGALAACQEIVIKAHAGQLGINLKSVSVKASGDVNLEGFFNLSDKRPGFHNVTYHTVIETDETDRQKLKKLEQISLDNCPVLDIIKNPVPVTGKIDFKH